MENKNYGSRKLRNEMNSVDVNIDAGLDVVLGPEYKAYVKTCNKQGRKPKTFAEWANS